MKNKAKYYMINKDILWRKEKGNFMVLFPISKKFLVFQEEFSKYVVNNSGYITYSPEHNHIFDMLIKNKVISPNKNKPKTLNNNKNILLGPLNVTFQITNRCNLDCKHCHRTKQDFKDMPLKEFKKIINELKEMKVFNINISGGEPLLHPNIFEMVDYVIKKGLNATMSTNLLLWNDIIAKKMSQIGLKHIHVSFDSHKASSYDDIRGIKGSFNLLLNRFQFLKKYDIKYTLVTTIINQSAMEYSKTIDAAFKLGATAHKTNTTIKQGDGSEISIDISDFSAHKKIWIKKKKQYLGKMNVIGETMFLIQLGEEYISPKGIPKALNCGCPAGILTCAINEKGDILACPFFGDNPLGNIYQNKFTKIRKSSPSLKRIRDRSNITQCKDCCFIKKCGGCRARSFGIFKKIDKQDPYCFLNTK